LTGRGKIEKLAHQSSSFVTAAIYSPDIIAAMICPICSSRAMLVIAWPGELHPYSREPDVFIQYRCGLGHYFETLSIFTGTIYQEHYIWSDEQKLDIRTSLN